MLLVDALLRSLCPKTYTFNKFRDVLCSQNQTPFWARVALSVQQNIHFKLIPCCFVSLPFSSGSIFCTTVHVLCIGTLREGSGAIFRPTVDISYADGLPRTLSAQRFTFCVLASSRHHFLHNGSCFASHHGPEEFLPNGLHFSWRL